MINLEMQDTPWEVIGKVTSHSDHGEYFYFHLTDNTSSIYVMVGSQFATKFRDSVSLNSVYAISGAKIEQCDPKFAKPNVSNFKFRVSANTIIAPRSLELSQVSVPIFNADGEFEPIAISNFGDSKTLDESFLRKCKNREKFLIQGRISKLLPNVYVGCLSCRSKRCQCGTATGNLILFNTLVADCDDPNATVFVTLSKNIVCGILKKSESELLALYTQNSNAFYALINQPIIDKFSFKLKYHLKGGYINRDVNSIAPLS